MGGFDEKVSGGWRIAGVFLLCESVFLGSLATMLWAGRAETFVIVLLISLAVLFGVLCLIFARLSLRVDGDGVHASWGGVINKHIRFDAIDHVAAEPYRWKQFGGWGWRFTFKGDIAFSQLGVGQGLRIYLKSGKSVFITCHRAAEAMEAIAANSKLETQNSK